MRIYVVLSFILAVLVTAGCSSTPDYKGVYDSNQAEVQPLEVPPGLSRPTGDGGISPELAQGINSYSGYQENMNLSSKQEFLRKFDNVRFVRDGGLFWVEVNDTPEHVWRDVRDFFTRLGFKIIYEKPHLGLMQTDWKENVASLPQNWLRKIVGMIVSSEAMDSYRIRFEYDDVNKLTRVFIAHQGLREVIKGEENPSDVIETKWVRSPADPDLEMEMLMRFMAFRGMDEEIARQVVAEARVEERSVLKQEDSQTVLEFNETFSRTWRHVGVALDRLGVLVEDRNRSAGVYYIQLPETFVLSNKDSGFFSSLFKETVKPSSDKYLLTVEDHGQTTEVRVKPRGEAGQDLPAVAQKLLSDIKSNTL